MEQGFYGQDNKIGFTMVQMGFVPIRCDDYTQTIYMYVPENILSDEELDKRARMFKVKLMLIDNRLSNCKIRYKTVPDNVILNEISNMLLTYKLDDNNASNILCLIKEVLCEN